MSADVLLTGQDRDMQFTDVLVDTRSSRDLAIQQVLEALDIGTNDWPLSRDEGVPWYRLRLERGPNNAVLESAIRDAANIPEIVVQSLVLAQDREVQTLELHLSYAAQPTVALTAVVDTSLQIGDNRAFSISYFADSSPL